MAEINGTVNNDVLKGTVWADDIYGNEGNDVLYGYAGNDFINAGAGNDTVYGGDGNDVIYGGGGDDVLYGQAGNDEFRIFNGTNVLDGGVGDDTFSINGGDNILRGGTGDDVDFYQLYGGKNTIIDTDDSLAIDTVYIEIDNLNDSERVGLDLHIKNPADATELTIIKDYFNHTSSAYRKHFITKQKQYSLSNLQATFNTWALAGTASSETLHGSHVSDSIDGLGGNDVVYGYLGNDEIWGGDGNDILYGGGGDDVLRGGDGNDTLVGNDGDDLLRGGKGSDTYVFAAGSGSDNVSDLDDLNAIDTLRFSNIASTQVSFSRVGTDLGIVGFGGASDGVLVAAYFDNFQPGHNKKFVFSDKTLTLADMQSGVRRFTLNGTAAAETLYGSKVADAMYGLNGNDILYGYEGNDVLQGGLGNDTVFGHAGNDGLNGNAGNDVLNGGKANDTLYGGTGNDTDQYIFYQGDGNDTVIDTDDTTATDTLRFININSATATFSKSGKDLIVKYGAGSDQVTVKQFYDTSVQAGRKQFQFADKTIPAVEVPALLQQAQALKTAVAGLSSKESAIVVPANTVSNTVNLAAVV